MGKRRKNGCGTLICKGKGKPWLAKWKFNGQVNYRSTGETDRRKALEKLAEFVKPYQEETKIEVLNNLVAKAKSAEQLRTEKIEKAKRDAITIPLDEVMEKFINDLSVADITKGTKVLYRRYFKSFTEFVSSKHPEVTEMKQVTEEIAKEFLEFEKDAVGVDTYNFRLVFLKRVWKLLGKEGGCEKNVWDAFSKRKGWKSSTRREFTGEELAKIFDCVKDDDQMTLLFTLGIYTGLRKGDCCSIRWDNIDLFKREVVIIPQKTKRHMRSPIHIPMHRVLFSLLLKRKQMVEAQKIDDGGFVLPDLKDSGKNAERKIDQVFQKCEIVTSIRDEKGRKKVITGFHALRHTFVSMNINGGMNPMLVQKIVGHSSVNMTEHYFHQNHQAMVDGISKMPNVLQLGNDGEVIDVPVVEQMEVKLDKDVFDLLMKKVGNGDVNEVLRTMLKDDEPKKEPLMIGYEKKVA